MSPFSKLTRKFIKRKYTENMYLLINIENKKIWFHSFGFSWILIELASTII